MNASPKKLHLGIVFTTIYKPGNQIKKRILKAKQTNTLKS